MSEGGEEALVSIDPHSEQVTSSQRRERDTTLDCDERRQGAATGCNTVDHAGSDTSSDSDRTHS